jgi:aspartyl-tRNA(Asn)/glutamyl-tRNA(Gln) amidotransferase subunit A
MPRTPTLDQLARDLADGRTTSRKLVEDCLARIDDPSGEGARAFTLVCREEALAAADAMDRLRKAGAAPSRFAGIPVSIKDLFDITGQVTRGGSKVLADRPPATTDAPAVARLRQAGFVVIGRTNMTEFAFSGVGLNPHYGTPKCAWDRKTGRIPGGSSSGAGVSVADGMAHMGLGTDTGGSCRIPAAFNGIVGYKPTASRVPTAGALPLSFTLDSIGPLARTVACCAAVDAVLAGEGGRELVPASLKGLRVAAVETLVLGGIEEAVARDLERALATLSAAGAHVERIAVPEFDDIPRINAKAGFAAPEALAWHMDLITERGPDYDPRVLVRINRGKEQSAIDYIRLIEDRARLIAAVERRLGAYDVMAMPTVPMVAPPIAALDKDDDYGRINLMALRNPTVINMIDGCAISLPMHEAGKAPTGLMLAAMRGRDHHLLSIAAAVEAALDVRNKA